MGRKGIFIPEEEREKLDIILQQLATHTNRERLILNKLVSTFPLDKSTRSLLDQYVEAAKSIGRDFENLGLWFSDYGEEIELDD